MRARKWRRFPATEGLVTGSERRVPKSSDPSTITDASRATKRLPSVRFSVASNYAFGCRTYHSVRSLEN
ncbi:hypothetical protein HU200_024786 [Digitaria exilis]|uniref:Uncharacterized protein n=1 Tax=Digitaria exilis TaxID=1010633 RepID=A0A835ETV2_9POAL|nr:hypothetical protein HU200_024786 [Digitaria exilis]